MHFVDTNVLLYLISNSPQDAAKARVADAVVEAGCIALSVQVLQEFYVQSTRPRAGGRAWLTHQQATTMIESLLLRFPVQSMTPDLLRGALALRERHQISFWDAAIIEAARQQGCHTVLSEDLSHGHRYGPVRVVNPFR